ncbi:Glycosyltransferase involved in cell wall bisynthesis [Butyrivibrio sp. ob235]|uniref:glycosyltransferase n=1 Tax=Butyrivibrio sp. ob235 TaxID=1761780 RepID=UPI0008C4FBE7|nr:glycosyltransferase [Butyrivibrio sp. ob235]SEL72709.1 Glycosyltransferase involved in cell wall bisynthesis [Butyrivibrio sp. ob235]
MKKVLIVMPTLYNGGAEKSLINFLNELPKNKYEIDILLFKRKGLFLNQVPEEYTVLKTPRDVQRMYGTLSKSGLLLPWRVIGNAISDICTQNSREKRGHRWKYFYGPVIRKIDKEYDIALAYISGEVLYYVDEKVRAKKKIVWIHNDYNSAGHPKKYDYDHLKNMDAIVSISESCVDILKKEFPEFSEKIYMLENITSSKVLKHRACEFDPLEFENNDCNILSIGRLHEQKGFDMAIEAASILKSKGIVFKWFIIGSGPLEEELKKMIKKFHVEDCVLLIGARSNPYPYIAKSTVFVQPSRYEGKSVVLDEAKILAAAIITTAYPTVGDQLNDKEGLIVPMTPQGIADGLYTFIKDEGLRNEYTQFLAQHEYGNQEIIGQYIKLIDA